MKSDLDGFIEALTDLQRAVLDYERLAGQLPPTPPAKAADHLADAAFDLVKIIHRILKDRARFD